MSSADKHRDKQVTRYIHRTFWDAMFNTKLYFTLSVLLHAPSFFLSNVLVPFEIAYCIQAIILKDFNAVPHYIIAIIGLTLVANIILAIATWGFNRCGTRGA